MSSSLLRGIEIPGTSSVATAFVVFDASAPAPANPVAIVAGILFFEKSIPPVPTGMLIPLSFNFCFNLSSNRRGI